MITLRRDKYLSIAIVSAIFLVVLYVFVYYGEPFSEFWNLFLVDGIVALSAALAAFSASALRTMFDRDDLPRPVWTHFAFALGIWAIAETVWMALDLFIGELDFSIADGLWLVGYIIFAIAISIQYRILYRWSRQIEMLFLFGGLGLIITLTAVISFFTAPDFGFGTLVWYFYPIADFFYVLAILILVVTFRGGILAAPWTGLFVLIVSDALYLWTLQSGIYWVPGGLPRLFVDVAYVFAYLLFALGCFAQYLLYRRYSQDHHPGEL